MADAIDSGSNLQTRAFLLLKMLENSVKRRRLQTVLAYFAATRRKVITVCALTLFLGMHHRVAVMRQYSRNTEQHVTKLPFFSYKTLFCACSRVKTV